MLTTRNMLFSFLFFNPLLILVTALASPLLLIKLPLCVYNRSEPVLLVPSFFAYFSCFFKLIALDGERGGGWRLLLISPAHLTWILLFIFHVFIGIFLLFSPPRFSIDLIHKRNGLFRPFVFVWLSFGARFFGFFAAFLFWRDRPPFFLAWHFSSSQKNFFVFGLFAMSGTWRKENKNGSIPKSQLFLHPPCSRGYRQCYTYPVNRLLNHCRIDCVFLF